MNRRARRSLLVPLDPEIERTASRLRVLNRFRTNIHSSVKPGIEMAEHLNNQGVNDPGNPNNPAIVDPIGNGEQGRETAHNMEIGVGENPPPA